MIGRMIILFLILLFVGWRSYAQVPFVRKDTILLGIPVPLFIGRDSLSRRLDSLAARARRQWQRDSLTKKLLPVNGGKLTAATHAPLLQFKGGYASYGFNYRSDLDTPYTEKNITQHQVISTLNFLVAGLAPIRVNTFIRRSNSAIFQDITDVQVAFDAAAYRNQLSSRMRDQMLRQLPGPDSLMGKLYKLKQAQALSLAGWLRDPLTRQKLIEANEILKVPGITFDKQLPDSTNRKREDSLRSEARLLLKLYGQTKDKYDSLSGLADSLREQYEGSIDKLKKARQLANGSFNTPSGYDQWKQQLQSYAPGAGELPSRYRWLLGVRSFGLGRNTINSSELTARNLSLKGVNFEYNSWYYLNLSAGTVDYRFRDFVVGKLKQTPQYMYLVRAGLGRLEKNYLIFSVFGGRKQLLTSLSGTGVPPTVNLTGMSIEAKWQVERNTYVVAEAAQSFSPDPQVPPPAPKPGWSLSDHSNKALSVKFATWIPATESRLEAQYKFTGSNYQSFTAFQTNAEQKSWYVKGEQSLFARQLKLVASLRSNDFTNPYIVQNYKANTVFTTLSATFRRRGWPVLTAGYMPMSQLTMIGSQVEESRFQTLNAGINHLYKLGQRQASTNIIYTKFFNQSTDTGFIYYNSMNLYAGQTIFFRDFTATMALSHSQNSGYRYNVLEGNVRIPIGGRFVVGTGAKLNNLNGTEAGVGGFINTDISISRHDRLYVNIEKGYLPGSGTVSKLVPNTIGTINYTRIF